MGCSGRDGDGVDDHAALGALDLVDLAGLLLDGEVAVDDAHAALLGHGDGEARLGDGIHGGGEQRGVQGDVAGELGLGADLGGDDIAVGGNEENVVEGKSFGNWRADHYVSCPWAGADEQWTASQQTGLIDCRVARGRGQMIGRPIFAGEGERARGG